MKLIKLEEIRGNEILSRTIKSGSEVVLLEEGTVLKTEYIQLLKQFDIDDLYIKSDYGMELFPNDIMNHENFLNHVESITQLFEQHTYDSGRSNLSAINDMVLEILDELEISFQRKKYVLDSMVTETNLYEHSICVCILSIWVGMKMNLEREALFDLGVGSILHDIGFRYIDIVDYKRDIETLTETELVEYKKHSIYGYLALEKETNISDAAKQIVLSIHEYLDGSGYPLKKRTLSREIKIACICNDFSAYARGFFCKIRRVDECLKHIMDNVDKLYDREASEALLSVMGWYPTNSKVLLDNGKIAVVVAQSAISSKPYISLINDEENNITSEEVINLSQTNDLRIIKSL